MDRRPFRGSQLVAAVGFVGAVAVLAVQLFSPSPVMVSIGENGAEATQVGQYFTYTDVIVLVVSALICGASGVWLLFDSRPAMEQAATPDDRPLGDPIDDESMTADSTATGDANTEPEESSRERWERTAARLRNNEKAIYSLLVDADGQLPQRDLVAGTDLSKATVSRTLDALEQKDLVERKRQGMGNVVHIQ